MLRDGSVSLFKALDDAQVPLLVFSAGIADLIEEVFIHFMGKYATFLV